MIRTEIEYNSAVTRVNELYLQIIDRRERMRQSGLFFEQKIQAAVGELQSRCQRIENDLASYARRRTRTWAPLR